MTEENWVIDLDGVIWLLNDPIPGSIEAVAQLVRAGITVTFATNNSTLTKEQYSQKLERLGIDIQATNLVTSAMAAASMVAPGSRAYVVGAFGINDALANRGVEVVDDDDVDVVVVGLDREISYDKLSRAGNAIRNGATFIATNTDATFPITGGLLPGAGSMVAAVATVGGKAPLVAGKPSAPMAKLIRDLVGQPTLMVGDRFETDGAFANELACGFGLVLSGVSKGVPDGAPKPAYIAANFSELVNEAIAGRGR
ncbi:HAD-IIA family hydrolase [Acidithrix ferrooxidans]|uniref:Putative hydrolase YutF n=1 Tax=Acidithrix ferrooxidans TaxID=1280514 RepID=A0A0D8HND5_9ACTN|nr:HAD-IIA family hydrolase [Acidithrix ferrooxidans]KJF18636.1 putative hydrolase YutF [Acidithrix ferrooxidans]